MARKATVNTYFGKEQEEWVVKFKYETDPVLKEKIFRDHLHGVFLRMIEAIMNRYKTYNNDLSYQQTIDDCLSYVLEKLPVFDETKGFKAYSFLGTVAKRYMNTQKMKSEKTRKFSTIEPTDDENEEIEDTNGFIPSTANEITAIEDADDAHEYYNFLKNYLLMKKDIVCHTTEDRLIFDAMITLMNNPEELSFFNKKVIYLHIKEISGIDSASKITEFLKKIHPFYHEAQREYYR